MQPVEDPVLPEHPLPPPPNFLIDVPFEFPEAAAFDETVGYADFAGVGDVPSDPPSQKTHYAIPFDINDDTDRGKHHPKTVGQCLSDHSPYSFVLMIRDRSLRCECARCPMRLGRSHVGGRR